MSNRVAIIHQPDYEPKSLKRSIQRAIELSGFNLEDVSGRTVLLKPNMLGAFPPGMAVTTNPTFLETVATIFREAGALVSVGDSASGIHTPERCWNISGLGEACRRAGVDELRLESGGSVDVGGIMLARAAMDADFVINIPKFKTHSLTVLTLAVKNLFGCVNGMLKSRCHRENPERTGFAELLVDISERIKPALSIIDGIVAMEGNGPSAGKPVNLNTIIAGTDVHMVDAASCRIIGLDPLEVDTLAAAKRKKLWDESLPIELAGDPLDKVISKKFLLPATHRHGLLNWKISRIITAWILSELSSQPIISAERCRKCLNCIDICPAKAIDVKDKNEIPVINNDRCIQCFCCHEICPYAAIDMKQNFRTALGSWLTTMRTRFRR